MSATSITDTDGPILYTRFNGRIRAGDADAYQTVFVEPAGRGRGAEDTFYRVVFTLHSDHMDGTVQLFTGTDGWVELFSLLQPGHLTEEQLADDVVIEDVARRFARLAVHVFRPYQR